MTAVDAAISEAAVALAALAPPGVRTGVRAIGDADLASLHDSEHRAIGRAVEVRRREFATGRALLRALIGADCAIPVRPDRAPQLPSGTVGSLAHDRGIAVAAVADGRAFRAIGIDVEPTEPLSDELAQAILRPDEPAIDAHLAFVLKEAAYKAWSSLGGPMLDHHDLRLRVDGDSFDAEFVGRGRVISGRFGEAFGRYLALVAVGRGNAGAFSSGIARNADVT